MRAIKGVSLAALSTCFTITVPAASEFTPTPADRDRLAALTRLWTPPSDIWEIPFFTSSDLLHDPVKATGLVAKRPRRKPALFQTARLYVAPSEVDSHGIEPGNSRPQLDHTKPLLGSLGSRTALSPISRRWQRVKVLGDESQVTLNTCLEGPANCANQDTSEWAEIIRQGEGMSKGRRIAHVNRAINRMLTYREDIDLWRRVEYWATPMETLSRRAGDCEDYAILKYWSLRQLGFADRDMRVVALRDRAVRQDHAVLAVFFEGDWLILDNRFSRVRLQRDLPHYQPLYSVNRSDQWSHTGKTHKPVRLAARLKQFGLK